MPFHSQKPSAEVNYDRCGTHPISSGKSLEIFLMLLFCSIAPQYPSPLVVSGYFEITAASIAPNRNRILPL
jgi:hypothetical protein